MIVQPIGKFKLTYANGISQVKLLITQEDYKSIVKPILDNIAELEAQRSGINKKSKRYKEISEKLRELKKTYIGTWRVFYKHVSSWISTME